MILLWIGLVPFAKQRKMIFAKLEGAIKFTAAGKPDNKRYSIRFGVYNYW